ncbi:hypothetical protein R1sor_017066 [Riccia sorocarpa]|uniref:Uncharacterized protein n=1 Tax=Riccia sorocarpa TaxID=122646 RepID=A0ABD3I943_9MARC
MGTAIGVGRGQKQSVWKDRCDKTFRGSQGQCPTLVILKESRATAQAIRSKSANEEAEKRNEETMAYLELTIAACERYTQIKRINNRRIWDFTLSTSSADASPTAFDSDPKESTDPTISITSSGAPETNAREFPA